MLTGNGNLLLGSNSGSSVYFKNILGSNMNGWQINNFESSYWHLYLGTGTTAPAVTDYCLETGDSNLTLINQSMANAPNNAANFIKTLSATWQNNTNNDVSITESAWYANGNGEWNSNYTAMMAREVFDPVTLHPGESYTFTMTIG